MYYFEMNLQHNLLLLPPNKHLHLPKSLMKKRAKYIMDSQRKL